MGDRVLRDYLPSAQILPIFRPPGGYYDLRIGRALFRTGVVRSTLIWSLTTGSTGKGITEASRKELLRRQVSVGASRKIILAHANPVDASGFLWLIEFLRSSGYDLVDLSKATADPFLAQASKTISRIWRRKLEANW